MSGLIAAQRLALHHDPVDAIADQRAVADERGERSGHEQRDARTASNRADHSALKRPAVGGRRRIQRVAEEAIGLLHQQANRRKPAVRREITLPGVAQTNEHWRAKPIGRWCGKQAGQGRCCAPGPGRAFRGDDRCDPAIGQHHGNRHHVVTGVVGVDHHAGTRIRRRGGSRRGGAEQRAHHAEAGQQAQEPHAPARHPVAHASSSSVGATTIPGVPRAEHDDSPGSRAAPGVAAAG